MKHLCPIFLFVLAVFLSTAAYAIDESDAPTRTIEDYIKDYVDIPKGALDWKLFGMTEITNVEGRDKDGMDIQYFSPGFSLELQAYDNKQITLKGFMFPLDSSEDQKLFLFGPFPMNCPFQYHVGPNLVVEVHADKKPIPFSYDPVTLTGTLELVPKDIEYGVFYRLQNAKIVK